MKCLSMDLRRRILAVYDKGHSSREEVARRFEVSLGMVKKLIQQRSHTGDIRPRYYRCGRPPLLVAEHQRQLRALLGKKSDLTLSEMREALGLDCSLQAIHLVLVKMGLSYKKRRSVPVSKDARTSRGRAAGGVAAKGA
jgi:transposase